MYYIICGGQIVESQMSEPSQDELQRWANDQNAHVYVISGEHYGMSADPTHDCSQCHEASPGGLFYIGDAQLCGECANSFA